jgi:hypothetical protein
MIHSEATRTNCNEIAHWSRCHNRHGSRLLSYSIDRSTVAVCCFIVASHGIEAKANSGSFVRNPQTWMWYFIYCLLREETTMGVVKLVHAILYSISNIKRDASAKAMASFGWFKLGHAIMR